MDTDVIMIGLGLAALVAGLSAWLKADISGLRQEIQRLDGRLGRPQRGPINPKATSLGASTPSKGAEILRVVSNEEDLNRLEASPSSTARPGACCAAANVDLNPHQVSLGARALWSSQPKPAIE